MRRCGVLSLLLLICLNVSGQKIPLTAFKDSLPPKMGAGDLYDITKSPHRFEVMMVRDTLTIIENNDSVSASTTFSLKNGKLVGYDYGEFGGHLVYHSTAGVADTIFDGSVQHIFSCYGRIFFTSGLWHMTTHYGHLFQLDTSKGEFTAKMFSSFDYPIRACHVTRDSMYLLNYGTLYRMQYGKAVVVTALPFVATSMTSHGRYMYFGMHGGYARYDMKLKQFRYFVYLDQQRY